MESLDTSEEGKDSDDDGNEEDSTTLTSFTASKNKDKFLFNMGIILLVVKLMLLCSSYWNKVVK